MKLSDMPIFYAKDYELSNTPHTSSGYDFNYIETAIEEDVKIKARPGANLQECMREALILMCMRRKTITLNYRNTEYKLLYPDVLTYIQAASERH
jgi:reverse gyrase